MAGILIREVAVMFLLLGMGMVCKRKGVLNEENARAMSNLMLLVVMPAILIRSLQTERQNDLLPAMGITLLLAILYHVVNIAVAGRVFRDQGEGGTAWRVSRLAVVFSNAAFMGFPLLLATVGETGLLYGAMFTIVFNVTAWVWCVPTLTGSRGLSARQLATNPVILASAAALALYLLDIRLPDLLYSPISLLAGINTPVSLLIIGVFLASVNPRDALRDKAVYKVILLHNLLLPLLMLAVLWAARVTVWLPGGKTLAISFLIMAACPSAANTILMPARYGCDSAHGAKLVAASTALSIVTIPLVATLGDLLL